MQVVETTARGDQQAEYRRLRTALDCADIGIWEWERDTDLLLLSSRARAILGLVAVDGLRQGGLPALAVPDDRPPLLATFSVLRAGGSKQVVEFRVPDSAGTVRRIRATGLGVRESDGRISRLVGTVEDISDSWEARTRLEQALAEQELLLREVNHRVKNSLQLVASLLALEAATSADRGVRRAFDDACGRVVTVARLHERLYNGPTDSTIPLSIYLPELVRDISHSLGLAGRGIRLVCRTVLAPRLAADQAVALALVVNELVTNAVKHAFADGRTGQVEVSVIPADGPGGWVLEVKDDGAGFPAGTDLFDGANLGLHIVRTLSRQLRAVLEVSCQSGTAVRLLLPG